MSRSYREPYACCGYGGAYRSFAKRQANKRVRKCNISNGSIYKKYYCSYDICDYKFFIPDDDDKYYRYKCK